MQALDLTIVIPVRNEELNLPGCLAAIGLNLARQIVVVDSGSTDRTLEIARASGAEIIDFQWNGKYPKKRNWFLRNYPPATKWVLFLDADEYLTDEFKAELRRALASEAYAGYWLSYSVYFLGKQMRGGYPLRKLALFQVGAGEYEQIDEQQWTRLDMEVHEHPILRGQVGTMRSKIDHQDFRGVEHYTAKHNEYVRWEVARFLQAVSREAPAKWTWRQRLKYELMQSPLLGPAYFLGSFLFLGGFLDGGRGLAMALLKTAYFTQMYCLIREARQKQAKQAKQAKQEEPDKQAKTAQPSRPLRPEPASYEKANSAHRV